MQMETLEAHPPDTNRGVETHTSQQIDWLSLTYPSIAEGIFPDELTRDASTSASFNAYDNAQTYTDGRVLLWHSTRPEMGQHCVLSGTTCSTLRASLHKIIYRCWEVGGHVSRLDLALNDLTSRIHAEDSTGYIERNEQICRAKEYPVRTDPRQAGYTQYAGKMASEVHVCIYDKSAEQKEAGFHVRVEIRFKGKKADKAAHSYLQLEDVRPLIRGFIDFPTWSEWQNVFSALPVRVPAEKKDTDRVKWLLTQVSAALAKQVLAEGESSDIMKRLEKSVREHISDLRHTTE
jgi:DNA relaxase NicK